MIENEQFRKTLIIEPTAASIGISKDDWYCHTPGVPQEEVRQTMLREKYDVVPILNKNGILTQYFTLINSTLTSNNITSAERIYYMTHVRDLVTLMRTANRSHFFLANHRFNDDIVGLVSLSNLNCKEFYIYLFSLISYVEKGLASLIDCDEREAFKKLEDFSVTKELREQLGGILYRLKEDRENNNENSYKEYLYIHHLICLVKTQNKYKVLNYRNTEAFESGTSRIREIRNSIAHPVRSLVRNLKDLESLEIALLKLYDLKERLENILGSHS
jgi:hypothetical protein